PDNLSAVRSPAEAACVTEPLTFCKKRLTVPDSFFRKFMFRDIHYRADNFFVADLVPYRLCKIKNMLYGTIRHQQPMLKFEVMSALRRALKYVFTEAHIIRMNSLQYQVGRRLRPGRIAVNPSRFLRPKYPLGTYFHSDTSRAT